MKVVNLKGNRYTVYIGRAGHDEDGFFGNPVKMDEACCICHDVHPDRGSTLPCYEVYLHKKLEVSSAFRARFMALMEDDVLGCFCSPEPCHGNIIIKVWKELQT